MIQKTSTMVYPLEAPTGWFLNGAVHEHRREGETHWVPVQQPHGPWIVNFKRNIGEATVTSRGQTLEQAWMQATELATSYELVF